MPRPSTGLMIAGGLATVITLLIAWPIVLAPTERIYGHEILGRYADAYAVIQQMAGGSQAGLYGQPLTDAIGRLLAQVMHPVAAYNVLLLLSFPLTAMATYALARYLHDSHGAALIAALVFAFAPQRLAQAAYHVDLVQMQWLPLFFLALIALVDRITVVRLAGLAVATVAMVFSNDYAALVGLLLSPVVLGTFWIIRPDANRNLRPLAWPALALGVIVAACGYVMMTRHLGPFAAPATAAFPIEEVAFYRARWWAYLTPSIDHPFLGRMAGDVFGRGGINMELLEQQLYLGYAFLCLALIALVIAPMKWQTRWRGIVALSAVGLMALLISVAPTSGGCGTTSIAPGCLMYRVLPALRDYGRFAMAVNLVVAIAAGAGAVLLARASSAGRVLASGLLVIGVFEYLPLPARTHDVLPSLAHRWIAREPSAKKTLDCFADVPVEAQVPWLTGRPLSLLNSAISTCSEPNIAGQLTALGYTHVIERVRLTTTPLPKPLPEGLTLVKEFPESKVYAVSATPPAIVAVAATGFFGYEHSGDDWWRWMSPEGRWTVRNTTSHVISARLALDLVPVGAPRTLTVTLDGTRVTAVACPMERRRYEIGPMTLSPGDHVITFSADGEPLRPSEVEDSKDRRPLTIAFHNERWTVE